MFQAFVVVLREGFEAFLIVAIILAYLAKTQRAELIPAVHWGIFSSVFVSGILAYVILKTATGPLWEGILGLITAFFVGGLVVQMWLTAGHLKQDMENRLTKATAGKTGPIAFWGVFLFTVLMISREGMEMVLMLFQIREPRILTGILLGILAAVTIAVLWGRFGYLINLRLFFQITSVFLLLLLTQILLYSFHELTEAGIFPNSEAWHKATEPFTPNGIYGRWLSIIMFGGCSLWLVAAWLMERSRKLKYAGSRQN